MASTEMVPDLIWAFDFFGPQGYRSPRNLVPEKFGSQEIWAPRNLATIMIFMQEPNFPAPKFPRAQISWGPKKSGAQMRLGTISVIAFLNSHLCT